MWAGEQCGWWRLDATRFAVLLRLVALVGACFHRPPDHAAVVLLLKPSTYPHHYAPPARPPAGGINDQQYVRLRSEAKAPFRLTRIIFLGGLAVGAALGLFIITGRLLAALAGGCSWLGGDGV